ncbi:MAG: histidine phosphatase family protein [Alphaproteobacteria bacterium]
MIQHFYFFRHGQTNENADGAVYGCKKESYLTLTGESQANKLREFLADKNIQVVYSSPLKRAIDTATIAINNSQVKIIPDDRLIEAAFGFWYTDDDEKQKHIMDNFNRIKSCLSDIVATDKHKNIAIASHGGVTRALCCACGLQVGGIKNCQCFHFTLDNGKWTFVEDFDTGIEVQNKSDIPQ